jgi:very-short-patch-repair endonuclease
MSPKNMIIGQRVTSEKAARARELRREMPEEERILWQHLRTNRLGGWHFRRQQVIAGFIVDWFCGNRRGGTPNLAPSHGESQ